MLLSINFHLCWKNPEMYCLAFWKPEVQNRGVSRAPLPRRCSRETVLAPLLPSAAPGVLWLINTSLPSPVITWHSLFIFTLFSLSVCPCVLKCTWDFSFLQGWETNSSEDNCHWKESSLLAVIQRRVVREPCHTGKPRVGQEAEGKDKVSCQVIKLLKWGQ